MNLSVQRDCLICDLSRKNYKDLHVADLSNATNFVLLPTPYYIFWRVPIIDVSCGVAGVA